MATKPRKRHRWLRGATRSAVCKHCGIIRVHKGKFPNTYVEYRTQDGELCKPLGRLPGCIEEVSNV